MSESRAEEVDRISCEEEERVSSGYEVSTYFAVDGGNFDSVRKATARSSETSLLNLRFIAAARLYHVNSQWRAQRAEGFPLGLTSGDWRSSMPGPNENVREEFRLVKLFTSNVADALYIEPIAALGLKPQGVITLEHALKRAIETVFQVEPNEIAVVTLGDPECPNILIYEAAEGIMNKARLNCHGLTPQNETLAIGTLLPTQGSKSAAVACSCLQTTVELGRAVFIRIGRSCLNRVANACRREKESTRSYSPDDFRRCVSYFLSP
jgi:hypothetical protein